MSNDTLLLYSVLTQKTQLTFFCLPLVLVVWLKHFKQDYDLKCSVTMSNLLPPYCIIAYLIIYHFLPPPQQSDIQLQGRPNTMYSMTSHIVILSSSVLKMALLWPMKLKKETSALLNLQCHKIEAIMSHITTWYKTVAHSSYIATQSLFAPSDFGSIFWRYSAITW